MKLFLIDGHALVFKMYYAFLGRPMVNTKGVDTSILFGFTKYLLELIAREKPTHVAVAFDPPGGTFRNKLYPEYKANRAETPQLVIDALEPLTSIVEALGIPVLMVPGYEADDVIGTVALKFSGEADVYMVTPDKDYGQLVRGSVFQYRPGKSGAEAEILGPEQICSKWNISGTTQVIDVLALCGDSADNVPGVQGIGPVGAAKLLAKYGSLEGIYEHIDELTAKQQQMLREAEPHISLSKTLVTIDTAVPIEIEADRMVCAPAMGPDLDSLLRLYEMNSLRRLVPAGESEGAAAGSGCSAPGFASGRCGRPWPHEWEGPAATAVGGMSEANLSGGKPGAGQPEGDPGTELPEGKPAAGQQEAMSGTRRPEAAATLPEGAIAVLVHDGRCVTFGAGQAKEWNLEDEALKALLENPSTLKAGFAMKGELKALKAAGIELRGALVDAELIHYLLNPERSHRLEELVSSYLGIDLEPIRQESLFDEAPEEDYLRKVEAVYRLCGILYEELGRSEALKKIYDDVEEPLLGVLSRMESEGVYIDFGALRSFADSLRRRMYEKEALVREIAAEPTLNVSSPKQIGQVIFEKLRLDPKSKKPSKGSWPTDEQTLLELSDRSPIIEAILDYRGTRKLLSTYIEPLPGYVSPSDGRIHTTFNQTLTSTGRLSSSNPNLQNIPVRTEEGKEIRRAFVAQRPGWVIMSADYSQIELRLMAHLSADPHLLEAFRRGEDVHAATAAKIFHKAPSEVSSDERRQAKTANFGIMYGISAFGLSQRLGCSRSEAKQLIEDYFSSFPSIRGFIDDTLAFARDNGYVETIYGRRRYTPDISSHNATVRAVAERNAVNAPIQGSAADIIKIAMARVEKRLREEGLEARMVLQIHDELLLELPEHEVERAREILVGEMEGVAELSVPLTVECEYGKNWLDAH